MMLDQKREPLHLLTTEELTLSPTIERPRGTAANTFRSPFGEVRRDHKRTKRGNESNTPENEATAELSSSLLPPPPIGPDYSAQPTRRTRLTKIRSNNGSQPIVLVKSRIDGLKEDEGEGDEATGVIRCACQNNVDKGLMIQCETCLVWQHSTCVGIRDDRLVPAHYFCELCLPRNYRCKCNQGTLEGRILQCNECHTFQHASCFGKTPPRKIHYCHLCHPREIPSTPTLPATSVVVVQEVVVEKKKKPTEEVVKEVVASPPETPQPTIEETTPKKKRNIETTPDISKRSRSDGNLEAPEKLGREERKIAMLMKRFEDLEHAKDNPEKEKEQPKRKKKEKLRDRKKKRLGVRTPSPPTMSPPESPEKSDIIQVTSPPSPPLPPPSATVTAPALSSPSKDIKSPAKEVVKSPLREQMKSHAKEEITMTRTIDEAPTVVVETKKTEQTPLPSPHVEHHTNTSTPKPEVVLLDPPKEKLEEVKKVEEKEEKREEVKPKEVATSHAKHAKYGKKAWLMEYKEEVANQ
ncbi:PHD zinc finger-containing protein [Planoprotostelium fungivorum]|uniref:PHD zinc finger-containing protein n=1 Tax=Planoprotostelium fungivorum TaxID=1890364 RepID=A0A2P6NKT8_9EUKA|nr:PHD zinc finger-containing protein [Planoprotostelium fungivorum]